MALEFLNKEAKGLSRLVDKPFALVPRPRERCQSSLLNVAGRRFRFVIPDVDFVELDLCIQRASLQSE